MCRIFKKARAQPLAQSRANTAHKAAHYSPNYLKCKHQHLPGFSGINEKLLLTVYSAFGKAGWATEATGCAPCRLRKRWLGFVAGQYVRFVDDAGIVCSLKLMSKGKAIISLAKTPHKARVTFKTNPPRPGCWFLLCSTGRAVCQISCLSRICRSCTRSLQQFFLNSRK